MLAHLNKSVAFSEIEKHTSQQEHTPQQEERLNKKNEKTHISPGRTPAFSEIEKHTPQQEHTSQQQEHTSPSQQDERRFL